MGIVLGEWAILWDGNEFGCQIGENKTTRFEFACKEVEGGIDRLDLADKVTEIGFGIGNELLDVIGCG